MLKESPRFQCSSRTKGNSLVCLRELYAARLRTPLSIAFAFVATHNHFVLDRGGKVFKQSAPVIKLPSGATEDDHLAVLGLLNSSTACFWMKQVFHDKGSTVDSQGARQTTVAFENFREFTGTGFRGFLFPRIAQPSLLASSTILPNGSRISHPASRYTVGNPAASFLDAPSRTRSMSANASGT